MPLVEDQGIPFLFLNLQKIALQVVLKLLWLHLSLVKQCC